MPNYKIPQREIAVRVHMRIGEPLVGTLYVSEAGPGGGSARLLDRLNDPEDRFLALTLGDGGRLISCDWIVRIEVTATADAALEVEPETGPELPVTARLTDGALLAGRLVFAMPPARERLIDYLNSHDGFVPLHSGETLSLLNLRQIVDWVITD